MLDPATADAQVAAAYRLLEQLRWGGAPTTCPQCGVAARCYYLNPAGGTTRRTRSGAGSARRIWKCAACRRQFSVLTGTVLHGTKIDIRTWVAVLARAADDERIPAAEAVRREHGVSREVALQISSLLAAACDADPTLRTQLSGPT